VSDHNLDLLCSRLQETTGHPVLRNEPMSNHTTFGIGGPAEALFISAEADELLLALKAARQMGIPVTVAGNGSNLLVSDEGVEGLVLGVAGGGKVTRKEDCLEAGAGVAVAEACRFARREGLGGLDFLAGIPGTLGGAICMNAGAFGRRIGEFVLWVEAFSMEGEKRVFLPQEMEFQNRGSRFSRGDWVISRVALRLKPEKTSSIRSKMRGWLGRRKESLPESSHCAGCVFKNPPSCPAGKLLQEAGCKGLRRGGAVISDKHANVIINAGGATCRDVLALMTMARERVYQSAGVVLEPEVVIIGKSLPEPLFPPLEGERRL